MKTAISATECNFDAVVDSHFARCSCYVIHDCETGAIEFLPNPFNNSQDDVGKKVTDLLHGKGVTRIISQDFGIKVKSLLDSLKIQMVIVQDETMTVKKIIELLTLKSNVMPKMDGKGPDGKGPATGRGLGKCKGASTGEEKSKKLGEGMAQKRQAGGGKGKGKRLQSGPK